MRFEIKLIFLIVSISFLSACASYISPKLHSSDISITRKFDAYIETILVQQGIKQNGGLIQSIKETENNDEIARLQTKNFNIYNKWRATLERVATVFGIFNLDSKNLLALRVNVLDVKLGNLDGVRFVDITAQYEITDTSNSKIIFSKEIKSHAKPEVHYFVGNFRYRDAFDRAINNNVKLFVEELLKSKLKTVHNAGSMIAIEAVRSRSG